MIFFISFGFSGQCSAVGDVGGLQGRADDEEEEGGGVHVREGVLMLRREGVFMFYFLFHIQVTSGFR